MREALELVRLTGKESRHPAQLSGGERQRVALARSLVLEPDVLLLDEPLAALDPKLRKQMRLELKEMQRRVGITFLLVTHDQEEALSMSDQLAVMNAGAIEQVGTPQDVYLRPRTRFVAGFLGAVNWIDGVGLRPEVTRISRTLPSNGGAFRPATVTGSVFLGNCVHVLTRLESGEDAVAEIPRNNGTYQAGEANPRLLESIRRDDLSMTAADWEPSKIASGWERLRAWFLLPAWIWMAALFAAPFAIVIVYSLLTRGAYGGLGLPWTLENYQRLVDPLYLGIVLRSFVMAAATTRHLPAAGLSAGAVHLARGQPQEYLPATGDSAVLDQLPGAALRVAVPAARYRPDQHRAACISA